MVRFFGSNNSRYFAVKLANEVRLYRGITAGDGMQMPNEAGFLWSRQVDDNVHGQVIRIGNSGDLFFQSQRGLFRMRLDRAATLDPIQPVCAVARADDGHELGRVCVDADGREVLYETIAPEAGLKDKLFRLLGSKNQANPSAIVHQIHPFSISSNQHGPVYPGSILDARKSGEFLWNASPCFRYLVLARPEKKTYNIQVIDVAESTYIDFSMPLAPLAGVWVNEQGTVMVDVRQLGSEQLIIGRKEGDRFKQYAFQPPASYEVAFLGRNFVALKIRTAPRLCIYNFEGVLQADVDVRPLQSLGIVFDFSFNERDDIDVLTWHQGSLFVHHSDAKAIVNDAKRWDLTARHAQIQIEERMVQDATVAHQEELRRLDRLDATQRLAASVLSQPDRIPDSSLLYEDSLPPAQATPIPSAPEPYSPPRQLQMEPQPPSRASLPAIGKRPFPSAETPPPAAVDQGARLRPQAPPTPPPSPKPLSRPSQPSPPNSPLAPTMSPLALAPTPLAPAAAATPLATPPVAPLTVAPKAPAPPVERPKEIIPSFLRGGSSLMPPPQTEEEDLVFSSPSLPPVTEDEGDSPPPPPPREVAVEPPPPPPRPINSIEDVPPPVRTTSAGKTPAELDVELDRLRMRYVAGELARDEYYRKRTELEAEKKIALTSMPQGARPPTPRRLDLTESGVLELPTGTPGPTNRKLSLGNFNLDEPL